MAHTNGAIDVVGHVAAVTFDAYRLRMVVHLQPDAPTAAPIEATMSLTGFDQLQSSLFGDGPFWLGAAKLARAKFSINERGRLYAYERVPL